MFSLFKNFFGSSPQASGDSDHPISVAFRPAPTLSDNPEAELKQLYDLSASSSDSDIVHFLIKAQQIQADLYPSYTYEKVKTFWKAIQLTQPDARLGHFIYLLSIEALKQGKLSDLLQSFSQEQITYTIASLSMLVEQEHIDEHSTEDNMLKKLLYGMTKESLDRRPDQNLFELAVEFNKAYTIFSGYDLQEQMNQALGSIKPNYDQIHFISNLTGNTLVNFQMILVNLAKSLSSKGETAHLLLYNSAFPGRFLSPETASMIESVMQNLNTRLKFLAAMIIDDPHRLNRTSQQLLTEMSEDTFLFFCTPRLGNHQRVPEQFKQSLRAEVTDVYRVIDLVEVS